MRGAEHEANEVLRGDEHAADSFVLVSRARESANTWRLALEKNRSPLPFTILTPPAAGPEGGEEKNMLISQLPTEIGWLAGRFPYP